MYEKHFGLKSRPFRSRLEASGIFVGPTQVKVMASLKKALAASDAVVTLTGPVGVGKSTVVNRALEGISPKRVVAHVGRMQLAADEVLELLLTEFNVSRQPTGTIQRFAAFKRLLHDWALADTRAFIIVEDAERVGTDALIELEALTAADSGDSGGASIVLMGQATLSDLLATPALARLRQRIRLRQSVGPFSAAELQGYLKHCIRSAGGEFDEMFDPGALDMIFRCCDGIPRVVNTLCESVLAAAAEANAAIVLPQLVQHVAQEQFGIQPAAIQRDKAETVAMSEVAPAPADVGKVQSNAPAGKHGEATTKPAARINTTEHPRSETGAFAKSGSGLESRPPTQVNREIAADRVKKNTASRENRPAASDASTFEPLPVSEFTAAPDTKPATLPSSASDVKITTPSAQPAAPADVSRLEPDSDVPELIQDTQPQLAALRDDDDLPDLTDLIVGPALKAKPVQKGNARTPALGDIPTLSGDLKLEKVPRATQPTAGKPRPCPPVVTVKPATPPAITAEADDEISKLESTITEIPDWDRDPTLAELKPDIAALEEALSALPEASAKPPTEAVAPPVVPVPKEKPPSKSFDLPEITLEKELKVKEVEARDKLLIKKKPDGKEAPAETPPKRKHGFDLDKLAAELGRARSLEDVDDKLAETLFGEEMANAAAEVAAMVAADEAARKKKVNPADDALVELSLEETEPPREAENPVSRPTAAKNSDRRANSAANAGKPQGKSGASLPPSVSVGPAVEITMQTDPDPLPPTGEATPDTIEEQFGTSMTATLKALSAAQVQQMDDSANDEDEKAPRRLFGLFRGSS